MVKRVEDNHKEQLNVIQKNVVRVLRAIMHFRDHVCTIVEKESLKDASRSLQGLGSLIPDKVRIVLVQFEYYYVFNIQLCNLNTCKCYSQDQCQVLVSLKFCT